MKTSKRSLITAIAVLCVCALSLSAASFAWFTSTTNANVSQLNLAVVEQSDLKVAIDSAATAVENIESTTLWKVSFTGSEIAGVQDGTYTESPIANATWDNGMVKPADETKINSETGVYSGTEMVSATATQDYVMFTLYFRSTEAGKTVKFNAPAGFKINEGKQGLKPALTLATKIGDTFTTYNDTTVKTGGNLCECSSAVGDYYVGSVDFYVYVDGENAATINQNAGITFVLDQLAFSYVE